MRVEGTSPTLAPYGQGLNKLSMFIKKKAYKLRGKAAEMRDLGPTFLATWQHYAPISDRNNEIPVRSVTMCACQFYGSILLACKTDGPDCDPGVSLK